MFEKFILNIHCYFEYYHWNHLSRNPRISLKFILDNLGLSWNWKYVSQNPRITLEDIENHPELPWEWQGISNNPNISMNYILKNPHRDWNWWFLSQNPSITLYDIINNPDKPWRWDSLSYNPNITIEFVLENADKQWDWFHLGGNPNIQPEHIIKYFEARNKAGNPVDLRPRLPHHDFRDIAGNPNITIKFILDNMHIKWTWTALCAFSDITIEDVLSNPDLPWEWDWLALNPRITIEDIQKYSNKLGKYFRQNIALNPNLTVKEILDNSLSRYLFGITYNEGCWHPYFLSHQYKKKLAKNLMKITTEDKYIAMIYNPNRMRSFTSIQDLEEMRLLYGWSMEEFNKYIK